MFAYEHHAVVWYLIIDENVSQIEQYDIYFFFCIKN